MVERSKVRRAPDLEVIGKERQRLSGKMEGFGLRVREGGGGGV